MRHLLFTLSGVVLSQVDLVRLFRQAMDHCSYPEKAAYTDMGFSQSQFSKQLNGAEPPRFLMRLHLLPRTVRSWFSLLLLETDGLPREVRRAVPLTLVLLARKRMVRATLHGAVRRERVS